MVCPPSRGLPTCLPACLPACFLDCLPACLSHCIPVPKALSPLSPSLSPTLSPILPPPMCVPLLDGVSAFARPCLPSCLPACLPSCFPLLGCVSTFPRVLPPFVSHRNPSCFPLLDGVFFSESLSPLFPSLSPSLSLSLSPSLSLSLSPGLSPSLSPSFSHFLLSFVGRCVRLPKALSPLFPSSLPSLSPFLFPFMASGLILHFCGCFTNYWMHASSVKLLAHLEAVGSGVENDVIVHFHPPIFSSHSIWQSYAAWFECLDPDTCTPIGCFLHRFSAFNVATKQGKPKKLNVKWFLALMADIFTIPVAAISCVWPCSSKHFLNPPTVWGLRWCNFFLLLKHTGRGVI